jgi:hypothetical protein
MKSFQKIFFNNCHTAMGRNGSMKCIGLTLQPFWTEAKIRVWPITSKGEEGNCFIECAYESIDALIEALKEGKKEIEKKEESL